MNSQPKRSKATVIRVHLLRGYTIFEVIKMASINPFVNGIFWLKGKRYLRAGDGTHFFENEVPKFKTLILN